MIEPDVVRKVARLARLELDDDAIEQACQELGRILAHVASLEKLDLRDVPPLMHATGGSDVYRDDIDVPPLPHGDALRNAPEQEAGSFRLPRIIGDA